MARDPQREQWLENEEVKFEYRKAVPLAEFDERASLRNQARLDGALDKKLVESYALMAIDNMEPPAVMAWQGQNGLVMIDGNHRYAAAREAEKQVIDCYVVLSKDVYDIARLTRAANALEGKRPTHEQLVQQAGFLAKEFNQPVNEVAKSLHIPAAAVRIFLRSRKAEERLARLGVPMARMKRTVKERLQSIANDRVFQAAGQLIHDAALPSNEVEPLLADVRREGTEAAQLHVIAAWRQRPEIVNRMEQVVRGKKKGRIAPKMRLFGALTAINAVLDAQDTLNLLQITGEAELRRLREQWAGAQRKMESLVGRKRVAA